MPAPAEARPVAGYPRSGLPVPAARASLPAIPRALITAAGLLLAWQSLVMLTHVPPFILPPPLAVLDALLANAGLIAVHAGITGLEMLLGFTLGTVTGIMTGLALASFDTARRWLLPLLVVSQALPVFALAPLLVLWLGYGLASKIAMATLIVYFPVTANFYDGLRRTEPEILDLVRLHDAAAIDVLLKVRLPAALPALVSGLRVAASVAAIGAVVGEWVGASGGLGYLMLHANARVQIDLVFAALLILALMSLCLYFTIDHLGRCLVPWQAESQLSARAQ